MCRPVLLSSVVLASAAAVLALTGTILAETYVVNPQGTGDFPTIQAAIDACVDGDIVELTDGTFTGDGNRDIDYLGKALTVRSQSGDPETCIINVDADPPAYHRGFNFHSGENDTAVLEGVTITHACMDSYGGAVKCIGSSPTIVSCVFEENHATWGAAVYCEESSVTVRGCRFTDNSIRAVSSIDSSPRFQDCCFSSSLGYAAGVLAHGGHVDLEECTFSGFETSELGSAVHYQGDGSLTVTGCDFRDNVAGSGGGLGLRDGYAAITGCVFEENSASYGFGGGALLDGSATVTDCQFIGNTAWYGGGIMLAGGESQGVSLLDCQFVENRADEGGGIGIVSMDAASHTVSNCTVLRNEADSYGGGLRSVFPDWLGSCELRNCTFSANSSPEGSGVSWDSSGLLRLESCIISFGADGQAVRCGSSVEVVLACCDIYGNHGGDWVGCIEDQYGVNGNISEDPLFCDPENDDFTLQDCSPCAPFTPPNPECDLIGAWPVACGGTPVTKATWGAVKALFKD